jgi:ribonuclease P protein component
VKKIRTRQEFQLLLSLKPAYQTEHFYLHLSEISLKELKVAALIPKRWAKQAVTRNLIRRQIYSQCFALEKELEPVSHMIRLKKTIKAQLFTSAGSGAMKQAVQQELYILLQNAIKTKWNETTPAAVGAQLPPAF